VIPCQPWRRVPTGGLTAQCAGVQSVQARKRVSGDASQLVQPRDGDQFPLLVEQAKIGVLQQAEISAEGVGVLPVAVALTVAVVCNHIVDQGADGGSTGHGS